jgi:hypothetical protein
MESIGLFHILILTGNTTGAAWPTCARVEQHPTSLYPTIDWFYASEMRSCHCKRLSHTLLNSANLHTAWQFLAMICFDNDVEKFCWYCLICYAHMNLNYTIFADLFLYVKHIEHQTLVLSCWNTWSRFRCCRKAERYDQEYRLCIVQHPMFLEQFELSATIMTNSSLDPNTSASKTGGLVHILAVKRSPHLRYTR